MNLRKRFAFRDRKGFALILVFSLASIVLLLALSLVSLTQVESASSRYDQGLRVARANARLALQMALGDLQEFAGPDQRITATADGARKDGTGPVGTSFNDDSNDPAINGVYQPFWTGVWNNLNTTDDPIWLVTRPLDATYDLVNGGQDADPLDSGLGTTNDLVKLVGDGSAKPENPGADQAKHDVFVPREPVGSTDIVGMDDAIEAAIGHYAYWVGDNGVKASYLLEDSVADVMHDGYELSGIATDDQIRLAQMAVQRARLEVDSRVMDAANVRLEAITSELALREEFDMGDSLLGSLTHNDVLRRFHDAAGTSHGLFADTMRGGLRRDVSVIAAVSTGDTDTDELLNEFLVPYLNVVALTSSSPTELTRSYTIRGKDLAFDSDGPSPGISPILTGMKLAVRVLAPDLVQGSFGTSAMKGQLEFSVRLWNPYTSALKTTNPLVFKLKNQHEATATEGFRAIYFRFGGSMTTNDPVGFSNLMNGVTEFEITANGAGEVWAPGETRSFIGVLNPNDVTNPNRVILNASAAAPIEDVSKFYAIEELPNYVSTALQPSGYGDSLDKIYFDIPLWTPQIDLETGSGELLSSYRLSGIGHNAMLVSADRVVKSDSYPNIAYVWELGNPMDADVNWMGYDPRSGILDDDTMSGAFDTNFVHAGDEGALQFAFSTASTIGELLGYNADGDIEYNIPLFELPRQEIVSLASLRMAESPSNIRDQLGMSGTLNSINDIFDRFYLSTVPQLPGTTWTVGDALPNDRMEPVDDAAILDLQSVDSAEHLYLRGAFNVNSTSVEAWGSFLKGIRLENWAYDDPLGSTPSSGQSIETLTGENQFLRFSQSAEETWLGTYDPDDEDDTARERFRKGIRSFSDAEIVNLAVAIVREIRTRRQSESGKMGPFVSLQDFIDSGVIETAIGATGANLNDGYTETYTSSYLTQQDVLTSIAPFLSVRSDTFVVRAYGDAVNPFDDQEILARAYCEAIVQRTHAKHATDPNSGDVMAATGEDPGEFGRQFKIIAFRWMTGDQL
jgi:hypothetical protein